MICRTGRFALEEGRSVRLCLREVLYEGPCLFVEEVSSARRGVRKMATRDFPGDRSIRLRMNCCSRLECVGDREIKQSSAVGMCRSFYLPTLIHSIAPQQHRNRRESSRRRENASAKISHEVPPALRRYFQMNPTTKFSLLQHQLLQMCYQEARSERSEKLNWNL